MANTFVPKRLVITTSYQTIYTCPSSTVAIVKWLRIANVDGANAADISARWTDSSAGAAVTRIGSTISVPADAAVDLINAGGFLVLEAGDTLDLLASANGDLEGTASIMEIT